MLSVRKESINKKITELDTEMVHTPVPKINEIDKIKPMMDSLLIAKKFYLATQKEQQNIKSFNSDTSFKYFTNYLSLNHDTFYNALNSKNLNTDRSYIFVPCIIVDTFSFAKDNLTIKSDVVKLSVSPFISKVSFFSKYPIFGYWLVLSIIQMTIWFLLIPIVFGMMLKIKISLPGYLNNIWGYLLSCLLPLAVIIIFAFIFYQSLIDVNAVIKDSYFMTSFNTRMSFYSIPGYLLAVLSFGGYLYLSKMLDKIDKSKELNEAELQSLKSSFNFLFLLCAIILSFFVVWVGITFIAVNSMESMKYYSLISGKLFLTMILFIWLVSFIVYC